MDILKLILLLEQFFGHRRKYRCDRLVVVFSFSGDRGKLFIHPENLSVIIDQNVGHLKLIEQFFLHRTVLRREIDQFPHKNRLIPLIGQTYNQKIDPRKYAEHAARQRVNHIKRDVHRHQEHCEQKRPAHIVAEPSF